MTLFTNTYMSDEDVAELETGFSITNIPAYRFGEGKATGPGTRFGRVLDYDGDVEAENTRLAVRAGFVENLRGNDPEFAARELRRQALTAVANGYAGSLVEAITKLGALAPAEVLAQKAWTKTVASAIDESDDFVVALSLMAEYPAVLETGTGSDRAEIVAEGLAAEAELDRAVLLGAIAEGRLGRKVAARRDADQVRRAAKALAANGTLVPAEKGYLLKGRTWTLTVDGSGLIVWAEKVEAKPRPQGRRANPTRKGGKAGKPGATGAVRVKASAATAAPTRNRRRDRRRGRNSV